MNKLRHSEQLDNNSHRYISISQLKILNATSCLLLPDCWLIQNLLRTSKSSVFHSWVSLAEFSPGAGSAKNPWYLRMQRGNTLQTQQRQLCCGQAPRPSCCPHEGPWVTSNVSITLQPPARAQGPRSSPPPDYLHRLKMSPGTAFVT